METTIEQAILSTESKSIETGNDFVCFLKILLSD